METAAASVFTQELEHQSFGEVNALGTLPAGKHNAEYGFIAALKCTSLFSLPPESSRDDASPWLSSSLLGASPPLLPASFPTLNTHVSSPPCPWLQTCQRPTRAAPPTTTTGAGEKGAEEFDLPWEARDLASACAAGARSTPPNRSAEAAGTPSDNEDFLPGLSITPNSF